MSELRAAVLLLALAAGVFTQPATTHPSSENKPDCRKQMLSGTLRFIDIETGVWQLVTPQGNYQLHFKNRPADFKSLEGKIVQVQGTVRADLLTTGMAGTVVEVDSISL